MAIPAAEVEVDEGIVLRLLQEQHPDLAHLPITYFKNGWDNFLFRLGEELTVRIPRRQLGADLIHNEQKFLPIIAPRLPLPVTVPIRTGVPGCGYPWHWSICPWIPGEGADRAPLHHQATKQWAEFLRALHIPGDESGPHNPFRGKPLATYCERFNDRFERLRDKSLINAEAVNTIWQQGLDVEPATQLCWGHGDLHTMNILCNKGQLAGVIDWGDIYVGDVAADLASFYLLFPEALAQSSLQKDYGAARAEIIRAKACAIFVALSLLDTGFGDQLQQDHPQQVAIARKIFANVGLV